MRTVLRCLMVTALTAACGQADSGDSRVSRLASDLQGTWRSPCLSYGESEFQKTTLLFNDGSLSRRRDTFTSRDCEGSSKLMTAKASGQYLVPADGFLDITYLQVALRVETEAKAQWAKSQCPAIEFPLGQEVDVSSCDEYRTSLTAVYDVFEVTGASDQTLYLAATASLTNEARPTVPDYGKPYQR